MEEKLFKYSLFKLELLVKYLFILILITGFSINYTTHSYIMFILMILISIFIVWKRKILLLTKLDYIIVSFLFVWFYGLILGLFNLNKVNYIVANFAGMVLYVTYFMLTNTLKINKNKFITILFNISLFNIVCSLLYTIYVFLTNENILNSLMTTGQIRFFYFQNMATYYILLAYTYLNLFLPKKYNDSKMSLPKLYISSNIVLFSLSIVVILLSASKGFMLGIVFFLLFSSLLMFKTYFYSKIVNKKMLYLLIMFLIACLMLIYFNYDKLFLMIFSNEDVGNQVRYIQFELLFNDLSFFGKGLGGEVLGNTTGNTYGFELSYLNIIHKFGFISLIIFSIYLYTFYLIWKKFNSNPLYSILALSCMCYLLPSIGNPILFSPINVSLHVSALYLLR